MTSEARTALTAHILGPEEYQSLARAIYTASGTDLSLTVIGPNSKGPVHRHFKVTEQPLRGGTLAIAYRRRPAVSVAGDIIEGLRTLHAAHGEALRPREMDIMWDAAITHLLETGSGTICQEGAG